MGTSFTPRTDSPPADTSLVPDETRALPGAAIAVDESGVIAWCRIPEVVPVWKLAWGEIGNVAVESRRTEFRGSFRGPVRTVIRLNLRNAKGALPDIFAIMPGHNAMRSIDADVLETIKDKMLARRVHAPGRSSVSGGATVPGEQPAAG